MPFLSVIPLPLTGSHGKLRRNTEGPVPYGGQDGYPTIKKKFGEYVAEMMKHAPSPASLPAPSAPSPSLINTNGSKTIPPDYMFDTELLVRCLVLKMGLDSVLHARMLLVPTPARLKRLCV
jgi:hypothetical protein